MISIFWNLLKSSRFILPFFAETIDENELKNKDDIKKAWRIKFVVRSFVDKFIYITVWFIFVFYYCIPLVKENASLNTKIVHLEERISIHKKEHLATLELQTKSQTNLTRAESKIAYMDEDIKKVSGLLSECKTKLTEYRGYLLGASLTHHASDNNLNKGESDKRNKTKKQENKQSTNVPKASLSNEFHEYVMTDNLSSDLEDFPLVSPPPSSVINLDGSRNYTPKWLSDDKNDTVIIPKDKTKQDDEKIIKKDNNKETIKSIMEGIVE